MEGAATPSNMNSEVFRGSSSDPAAAPEVHLPIICPVLIPRGEIRSFTFLMFLELGVHGARGTYWVNPTDVQTLGQSFKVFPS